MSGTAKYPIDSPEWIVAQLMAIGRRRHLSDEKLATDSRFHAFLDRDYVLALARGGTRNQVAQALIAVIRRFHLQLDDPIGRAVFDCAFAINFQYNGSELTDVREKIRAISGCRVSRETFSRIRAELFLQFANALLQGGISPDEPGGSSGGIDVPVTYTRLLRFFDIGVRLLAELHLALLPGARGVISVWLPDAQSGKWYEVQFNASTAPETSLYWYARYHIEFSEGAANGHDWVKSAYRTRYALQEPFTGWRRDALFEAYRSARPDDPRAYLSVVADMHGSNFLNEWLAWLGECRSDKDEPSPVLPDYDGCPAHSFMRTILPVLGESERSLVKLALELDVKRAPILPVFVGSR